MNVLLLKTGTYFICDTHVTPEPSAESIAETTLLAAEQVRQFGLEPKVALLSHSNFGSFDTFSSRKMRTALQLIRQQAPDLQIDGEMHGDAALDPEIRARTFPDSFLKGSANLLMMPTLDAANIAFSLLRTLGDSLAIGPILLGTAKPAHILTPAATSRGIVNMTAIAGLDANVREASIAALTL